MHCMLSCSHGSMQHASMAWVLHAVLGLQHVCWLTSAPQYTTLSFHAMQEAADKQDKLKAERKAGLQKKAQDAADEPGRHASGQQASTSGGCVE
jgi:hypothetical protein